MTSKRKNYHNSKQNETEEKRFSQTGIFTNTAIGICSHVLRRWIYLTTNNHGCDDFLRRVIWNISVVSVWTLRLSIETEFSLSRSS